MNDLLDTAIEAHGGLERWNQLDSVSARLIQGGALWALKGQAGVLDDVVVTASLHEERASHRPFGAVGPTQRVHQGMRRDRARRRNRAPGPWTGRATRLPVTPSRPRGARFSSRTSWARRCGHHNKPFTFAMLVQTTGLEPWGRRRAALATAARR